MYTIYGECIYLLLLKKLKETKKTDVSKRNKEESDIEITFEPKETK